MWLRRARRGCAVIHFLTSRATDGERLCTDSNQTFCLPFIIILIEEDEMQCYSKHNQNFRPNLTGVGQCVSANDWGRRERRHRMSRTDAIFVQNDTLLEIDSGGPTIYYYYYYCYYQRLLKYCWMLSLIRGVAHWCFYVFLTNPKIFFFPKINLRIQGNIYLDCLTKPITNYAI